MLVKQLFCSLKERLDKIEHQWLTAHEEEQQIPLTNELADLGQTSDEILDAWLLFEERLSEMNREIEQEDYPETFEGHEPFDDIPEKVAHKIFKEINHYHDQMLETPMMSLLSGDIARIFRKGQGYYQLLMYPHAAEHFQKVVEQDPTLDVARMFLAFCEMMNGCPEEADHHFFLVTRQSKQNILKATALNAQGCIAVGRLDWEYALHCYEQAVALYPKLKDPQFNRALALMQLHRYEEAKPIWQQFIQQEKEDVEALLQLALCFFNEGDQKQASVVLLQVRDQSVYESKYLQQTAHLFEQMRQFGNAAICFQLLLNEDPKNHVAWHGLGWNLWHADGLPKGIEHIRKAIALSPDHLDYRFSYGWILYHQGEYEQAERIFKFLLSKKESYPLAMAGLAQVLSAKQQWRKAKACCEQLIQTSNLSVQALGYFQAGRIALMQQEYSLAKEYFSDSKRCDPQLKDNGLWFGLASYLNGEHHEAQRTWDQQL